TLLCFVKASLARAQDSERGKRHRLVWFERQCLLQTRIGIIQAINVQQEIAEIGLGLSLRDWRSGELTVELQLSFEGCDLHPKSVAFNVLLQFFLKRQN